jgi:ribonuclease P protein component
MLPRRHRLRRSRDFDVAVRRGARASSGAVVATVLPGDQGLHQRLGLIVGRRVGGSVQRHRVSRVLRHAMRDSLADMPEGTIVVLRALPGAADRGSRLPGDAQRAVGKALGRL